MGDGTTKRMVDPAARDRQRLYRVRIVTVPRVETLPAINVTSSDALLRGRVDPLDEETSAYFVYGPTTNYGLATAAYSVGSSNQFVLVSSGVSGLLPQTTYHFNLVAYNTGATNWGGDQAFTTGVGTAPHLFSPVLLGGQFSVSLLTQVGVNYRLEYVTSLGSTNWIPVTNLSGSGGVQVIVDSSLTNLQRFYRVMAY
jgi:hypothetical protein